MSFNFETVYVETNSYYAYNNFQINKDVALIIESQFSYLNQIIGANLIIFCLSS